MHCVTVPIMGLKQGAIMARIAVRPSRVALMDVQTRMPSALGGVQ